MSQRLAYSVGFLDERQREGRFIKMAIQIDTGNLRVVESLCCAGRFHVNFVLCVSRIVDVE